MNEQKNQIISNESNEIEVLNLAELDVQELENRLELATLVAPDGTESAEAKAKGPWIQICGDIDTKLSQ